MSETLQEASLSTLLAQAQQLTRQLATLDLTHYSDEDTIAAVRANETLRCLSEPLDHALIREVEHRGIPAASGLRSTGLWLRQSLTIDIHEANARARAARAAGPRRSLLGEPLPASYPVVAAGQARGAVCAKQARVITTTLDKLPPAVGEQIPAVEARLVGFCATLDAAQLAQAAERERAWLHPDGGYRDLNRRRRERHLELTVRPDGSCRGSFQGTAELSEFLQTVFDSLAAPKPATDATPDPRTAGQRRHDALLDALKAAVGSATLPSAGGMLATVVLTMTEDAYRTGQGFARTGHGAQVPVREAMTWAGGD